MAKPYAPAGLSEEQYRNLFKQTADALSRKINASGGGMGSSKVDTGGVLRKGARGVARLGSELVRRSVANPIGAAAALPAIGYGAIQLGQSTVTPAIRAAQQRQIAQEAGYNFEDTMSPEANLKGSDMAWGRTGHMFQGAAALPLAEEQWPAVKAGPTGEPMLVEGTQPAYVPSGAGMVSTTRHGYGGPELAALETVGQDVPEVLPPVDEETPQGAGSAAVPKFDYEFNRQTRKFEARPYRSSRPRYRTLAEELGGTNLRGYGGLAAIAAAAQGAKSYNRGLNLAEKYAQEEAQSGLDWTQEGRLSDTLALEESLAPYKAQQAQSLAQSSAIKTQLLQQAMQSKDPKVRAKAERLLGVAASPEEQVSTEIRKVLAQRAAAALPEIMQMPEGPAKELALKQLYGLMRGEEVSLVSAGQEAEENLIFPDRDAVPAVYSSRKIY